MSDNITTSEPLLDEQQTATKEFVETITAKLSVQVTDPILLKLPRGVSTNIVARNSNRNQVPFTHIIIICLSYAGIKFPNGNPMDVQGTKNDFSLLLDHFGRFEGNAVDFSLLNDFEHLHERFNGEYTYIPKADTSKTAIREVVRSAMGRTTPESKVLFYFAGHGTNKAIIAGDGRPIKGSDLRSWLADTPHPSVPVTAMFDCCESGGLLGLPITYEETENGVEEKGITLKWWSNSILEISAARQGQCAFSNEFSGGYYCGQLTWYLLRYLSKNPPRTTVDDIVHYLNKRFEPSGGQTPQVSSSRRLDRKFPFF